MKSFIGSGTFFMRLAAPSYEIREGGGCGGAFSVSVHSNIFFLERDE